MPELVRTDGSLNQVDERMRILFVTPRYAPLVGGIETHCAEVAQRLTARGHDVTVLTTTPGGNLPAIEQIDGVSVRRVRAWPARGDLYLAPGIFQYVRRHAHELDVIHCQGYHTFVAPTAMLAARRAGVPYVVTFHSGGHSSRLRTMIRGPQQRALRRLFASASLLIGVSRFEANLFQKRLGLPPEKFAVVRNGSQLPREATVDEHPSSVPLILSVGRLERYKGHHRMIAAMPHVLEEIPDARLRIVGGAP
jgi:glycosyltransferase involved in cell wall biosynthesis